MNAEKRTDQCTDHVVEIGMSLGKTKIHQKVQDSLSVTPSNIWLDYNFGVSNAY